LANSRTNSVFTPKQSNAGVATTTWTTPEHRAVNAGSHTGNSADSRVILEEAVDDYDPAFET
jgi:hypothetical protein